MSSNKVFACPSCGASLTVQGHETEIKCSFCGTVVVVPEELREKPAPPVRPPAQMPQAPQMQPIVIVEPPQVIYEQAPVVRPRRRSCCAGCFGCLTSLLVILAVIGGILYTTQPGIFKDVMSQVRQIAVTLGVPPTLMAPLESGAPPQITSFTVTPPVVTAGGNVTVQWVTIADTVRLDAITAKGTQTSSQLRASDSRVYSIPTDATEITFQLTASRNGQQVSKRLTVQVRRR